MTVSQSRIFEDLLFVLVFILKLIWLLGGWVKNVRKVASRATPLVSRLSLTNQAFKSLAEQCMYLFKIGYFPQNVEYDLTRVEEILLGIPIEVPCLFD